MGGAIEKVAAQCGVDPLTLEVEIRNIAGEEAEALRRRELGEEFQELQTEDARGDNDS